MERIVIGQWEFDVDLETTRNYYENHKVLEPEAQYNRNYQEYCNRLSEPERNFFVGFGIDPKCCDVFSIGLAKGKTYPSLGAYFFAGTIIKKPDENITAIEEFEEENFDLRVYIGLYQFEFVAPDSDFAEILSDAPGGFIGIRFRSEKMPWLLKEKCTTRMYYPPEPWQLIKKIKGKIKRYKQRINSIAELKAELIGIFERHKINYTVMKKPGIKAYMNRWFLEIVPANNQDKARGNCLSTRKYQCYLWHAFSFGYASCEEETRAITGFDGCGKGGAVLILEMDYGKIGFTLDSINGITAEELNEFNDIIMTHKNFEWAYVHTHEGNCGPYFYQKSSRQLTA